jgi:hypothetical protein
MEDRALDKLIKEVAQEARDHPTVTLGDRATVQILRSAADMMFEMRAALLQWERWANETAPMIDALGFSAATQCRAARDHGRRVLS